MTRQLHHINGLSASSYLYFIAKHFDGGLIIVPSEFDLDHASDALSYFCEKTKDVLVFPHFERIYEPLRQEPTITQTRIQTQRRLMSLKRNSFLITNLEALSQKTISPQALEKAILRIKKGDWLERDPLLAKLLALGFRQDDLAEDAGFFSARGHLVDIFSPYLSNPTRIEFFGDEVISIRSFDSNTQRSLEELAEIEILPCRELILNPSTWAQAREQIRNFSDERGLSRDERDRVLDDLENHRELLEPRWLLPPFSKLTSLQEYFQTNWPLIVVDEEDCCLSLEKHLKSEDRSYETLERLAFGPEFMREASDEILKKEHHSLETKISGRGMNYQVIGNEELRAKIQVTRNFSAVLNHIESCRSRGLHIELIFSNAKRELALKESIEIPTYVEWKKGPPIDGFVSSTLQKAIISERDIFGIKKKRPATAAQTAEEFLRQFSDLKDGDYVIHEDHGVAQFRGLQVLELHQARSEFLVLEYADKDKLYLPIYRVDKVSRYISEGMAQPRLDKLGTQTFVKKKARIKADILRIAHELLKVAADRKLNTVSRPEKVDEKMYREFCQQFPYEMTADQESASLAIEADLKEPWPMDRLVCGDVGFGKTEVALRAAMRAVLQGKQVAVLAPTTILVEQHYRGFQKRFDSTPFKVAHLSRFVDSKEQKRVIKDLQDGKVHLVIGTHRLIQSDIAFKDLGLLIVDEEQRFGVKHKERIKKLKSSTDILTLSATPIPRTLQMSILGIRELSLIVTPPESREAVKTYIGSFDESLIRKACIKERDRGGQILFVHNRVQTIANIEQKLKKLLPEFKIVTGHGQMHEDDLEKTMMQFIDQKADILVATAIIEHGLDIPNANTIFIDHPEMFGLSDLYQLRGRVGRSHLSAYAYFLIHETTPLTSEASKRLQVIQSCTDLGSGFHVATHDMEIRGSGNILGTEQSGVIAEVGLELYTQMLQETLNELKNKSPHEPLPELNSGYTAYLPESYIPDPTVRISTYKRLDQIQTPADLLDFENELLDRFGLYSREVENLCQLTRLRVVAHALKASTIEVFPGRLSLLLRETTSLDPQKILLLLGKNLVLDQKGRLTFSFESALKKPVDLDEKIKTHPEMHDFAICKNFLLKLCETAEISLESV